MCVSETEIGRAGVRGVDGRLADGDAPIGVVDIGIAPAERLRYVMPPVAPGRYRLTQDVSVEGAGGELRRATVDRELSVIR